MPYCHACHTEQDGQICSQCGADLQPSPPTGPLVEQARGDTGLDRSVSQTVVVSPSPGSTEQSLPWDHCPIDGRYVRRDQTFRCKQCGRGHLCNAHLDTDLGVCVECALEIQEREREEKVARLERAAQEARRKKEDWVKFWAVVVLALALLALIPLGVGMGWLLRSCGGGPTPEPVVIVETVVVEATAEQVTVVETVMVEVEVPVEVTRPPGPEAAREPEAGEVRIREADGMEMVYVPAGDFTMGSPDGEGNDDEHPQHTVFLDAYYIDKTELTNAQYRQCVEAGACRALTTCIGGDPTYGDVDKGDHPVVCVSWEDARSYCEWADGRLPTEAEWEKAARGTGGRDYPWGDTFDCQKANFDDETEIDDYVVPGGEGCDGYPATAPAGSFPDGASPYGALDMAGNVWEWVTDWFGATYYADSPSRNPPGPGMGEFRVVRGGSWVNISWSPLSAGRGRNSPGDRSVLIGFRCGMSPTSSP